MVRGPDFAPYVPRLLREWLATAPRVCYRRISGTLVFADGSGFTALTERLSKQGKVGSEDVNVLLNHYFDLVLTAATEEGGDLLKFGGDAVLLLFTGDGNTLRAARAAIAMGQAVRRAASLETSAGRARMNFSVGLHRGDFDAFLVGTVHRELILTGPGLTEALAMEAAADGGEVLLSPSAAAELAPRDLGTAKGPGILLRRAPRLSGETIAHRPEPNPGGLEGLIPRALRTTLGTAAGEGEHRLVTTAFISFGGIDALLAWGGPTAVEEVLEQLICRTQEIAAEYGICFLATDANKDGGKIILTAGAPDVSETDDERMLLALRAISGATQSLPIEVKIGVSHGHVFAGDVGAPFRRTYTVIGDAVNLAARVMSKAAPGEVLATRDVLARSQTVFETRDLAPFQVKGKTAPVQAVAVGPVIGGRKRAAGERLPLAGRAKEMAIIEGALAKLGARRGGVIEIVGETGVGKTRLVEEAIERAKGITALEGLSGQYASRSPYFPFRTMLRALLGIAIDAGPREAGEELHAITSQRAPRVLPWLPLIALVIDAEVAATPEVDAIDARFRRGMIHRATVDLLDALLQGPAVMVFEDSYWMDDASRALLADLARATADRPWLILLTSRVRETPLPREDAPVTTLWLGPLAADEAEQLLASAGDACGASDALRAAVRERSAGHPLFLLELLAAVTSGATAPDALPESVEAVIASRIDELSPADRKVMRYASVLGGAFSPVLLQEAFAGELAFGRAALSAPLEAFVEPAGDGMLRFRHRLFRDAAYEGLPYRTRRELHARVVQALERRPGDAADQAELLAIHAEQSGDVARTSRYAAIAGDRARAKYANIEAADFYVRALAAGRKAGKADAAEFARLAEALGDVCEVAGRYEAALAAYAEARRAAPADGKLMRRTWRRQGFVCERMGQYRRALLLIGRARKHLASAAKGVATAAEERAEIAMDMAAVRFRQGRYRECVALCREAEEEATLAGARPQLAHACYLLGTTLMYLGDPSAADYRGRSLPIYEELGDLVGQANTLNNMGVESYYAGRWDEAMALYRRSEAARDRAGDVFGAATQLHNIAEILSDQGHLDEAERLFTEARKAFQVAHVPMGVAYATSNLGRLAMRAGRCEEASRLLAEARTGFHAINARGLVFDADLRLAENLLEAGEIPESLEATTRLLAVASSGEAAELSLAALERLRAVALLRLGEMAGAREAISASIERARSAGQDFELANSLRVLGEVAGEAEKIAATAEASALFARLGVQRPHVPGLTQRDPKGLTANGQWPKANGQLPTAAAPSP